VGGNLGRIWAFTWRDWWKAFMISKLTDLVEIESFASQMQATTIDRTHVQEVELMENTLQNHDVQMKYAF
jgi:hypothetical protein